MGLSMTDTSVSTRFTESDFRVGRVLNRTTSVFSRNFLPFFIVTAVASAPLLVLKAFTDETNPGLTIALALVGVLLIARGIAVRPATAAMASHHHHGQVP